MKTYGAEYEAEKGKLAVRTQTLVEVGGYFFADYSSPLRLADLEYAAYLITLFGIKSSDSSPLDGGTVEFGNVDLTFSSYILNGVFKNKNISIYEAFFDLDMRLIGRELIFAGVVDGQRLTEQTATLSVAPSQVNHTVPFPARRITKQCTLIFKGSACRYSGAETLCNKTYEQCQAYGNTLNNGGFKFLPRKGRKFVWGNTTVEVQ